MLRAVASCMFLSWAILTHISPLEHAASFSAFGLFTGIAQYSAEADSATESASKLLDSSVFQQVERKIY